MGCSNSISWYRQLEHEVCLLTGSNLQSLLIIGLDVVSLARSSRRAGFRVFAVDYFGDRDLKWLCQETLSVIKQVPGKSTGRLAIKFDPEILFNLTKELLEKNEIDVALLTTGLDDSPEVLLELNDLIPILGNHPQIIEKVRNKTDFFHELKRLKIPHPETARAENLEQAKRIALDIGYPVVIKPSEGFGGAGIRKADNSRELEQAFRSFSFNERILIQEYILGKPASISLISSPMNVISLTLNEQLLGVSDVFQEESFRYCGNIVPLETTNSVKNRSARIAEKIASHFRLLGSNGIDLVLSKEGIPYVIEVNPRFQGSLECVERVLDMNLVQAHLKSCIQGDLPSIEELSSFFCTRLVLFAPEDAIIPDLSVYKEARDVPMAGVLIEKGEPLCSVVIDSNDRLSSFKKAKSIAESIYGSILSPRLV